MKPAASRTTAFRLSRLASGSLFVLALVACTAQRDGTSLPRDPAPTYLLGIYKGCKRDAYLSSAVEKRLYQMSGPTGGEVRRLLPGKALDNAPPEAVAAAFRRACTGPDRRPPAGVLFGGSVEQRGAAPPFTLMHLFRLDLGSQEFAYRDHYCRGCDVARTLATQAASLLEAKEPAVATPPRTPTFCDVAFPPPLPAAAPSQVGQQGFEAERVAISVRAEARPVALATEKALRKHLELTGRELSAKARLTIAVEISSLGQAQLSLRVHPPKATSFPSLVVACTRCTPEAWADRLTRAVGRLLDEFAAETLAAETAPPPLVAMPLLPAVQMLLCTPQTASRCKAEGDLDSDPSLSPFFDPICGERVGDPVPH